MKFHPSKCYTISIGTKKNTIHYDYSMLNEPLEHIENVPYLGVHINHKLDWGGHINRTVAKANRSLGYITRNLQTCPQNIKAQAYMTLVRPILEYAGTAWDPHHQKHIDKLEQVQRKAARFVTNCRSREPGSVTQAMHTLKWQPPAQRREHTRLKLLYQIVNDIKTTLKIPDHIANKRSENSTRTRNYHTQKFMQPRTRTDIYKYSFFPRTVTQWNNLPNSVINCCSLETFSSSLNSKIVIS